MVTTRNRAKVMELNRTLVTQFTTQVADINLRRSLLRGSMAQRVDASASFQSGDATCSSLDPYRIENIKTAIQIHAFTPVFLNISYASGICTRVPCSGLFILFGELDFVEVEADQPTRFQFVAA